MEPLEQFLKAREVKIANTVMPIIGVEEAKEAVQEWLIVNLKEYELNLDTKGYEVVAKLVSNAKT